MAFMKPILLVRSPGKCRPRDNSPETGEKKGNNEIFEPDDSDLAMSREPMLAVEHAKRLAEPSVRWTTNPSFLFFLPF